MRDLRELEESELGANTAISLNDGAFHPHSLLAALYFSQGNLEIGEHHLKAASERGAPIRELESSLRSVDAEYKRQAAAYLVKKNKTLYAWAERYR